MKPLAISQIQKAVLDQVDRLDLPAGSRILDAPCGGGAALALALKNMGMSVTGADVDRSAAAILGDDFVETDLDRPFPWRDESFAMIVSTEGIEHIENHFAFLREMHRILERNGLLILTTPNIAAVRSRIRFAGSGFFGRDPRPLNESRRHPLHHISPATVTQLRYELHVSGFRLIAARHTHIKPVSRIYAVFVPWIFLYTLLAFRKEKDPEQRKRNREIFRTLFSSSVLFGENLMLLARKIPS
ncbi:MAG TPA: methyltransferase domain-containing protein [Acidobacteriota bacterium]|nr:methyltransferase domain-containing protein [Acidobacteriota bacterium]